MTRKMEAGLTAPGGAERQGSCAATAPFAAHRKRDRQIIASLIPPLAALAFVAALASPAHALTLQEQGWQVANTKCKGGDAKQCELREQLSGALKRKGCVFQEDGGWWKCSRTH